MHGTEEIEEKAIILGKRHASYRRARWIMRPPLHLASHPLCQLPNLMQIILFLKPTDFFEMTDAQTAWTTKM